MIKFEDYLSSLKRVNLKYMSVYDVVIWYDYDVVEHMQWMDLNLNESVRISYAGIARPGRRLHRLG